MSNHPVKVGIIGCGNISGIYFKNLTTMFKDVNLVACADLVKEKAEARQKDFPQVRVCTVEQLLADPEIEIVLNLTIPKAHADVALAAVQAGKSVYNEKPLTVTREDGARLLAEARARKVLVGGAPDTFLGASHQTCRKLIDDGWIGRPVAATAFMTCRGHERWHPDPEFYYKAGGGPMFDMGPYYLTAMVNLFGPVKRVAGMTRVTFPERVITSQPRFGTRVKVEVPTHVAGLMEFECGAVGTIVTSFDVWAAELPRIEVYGTDGSLNVPDPNGFGGSVRMFRSKAKEWGVVPYSHDYEENSRGLGVADLACALRGTRAPRAGGDLAFHVLDIMHAFHDAAREGRQVELKSTCAQPKLLPMGFNQPVEPF